MDDAARPGQRGDRPEEEPPVTDGPTAYTPLLTRLSAVAGAPPATVPYGPDREQFAELWGASAAERRPVAALLHGGYWRRAYRLDLMNAMAADLTARGMAVWNLEYRRVGSPNGGWPGTFEDVAAGFDALLDAARAWPLDTRRVMVVGHSAGGHLALWLASRRRLGEGPGSGPRLVPALVVSLAGVCDPRESARRHLSQDAVVHFLGGRPKERAAVYDHADPAARLPHAVPQLLAHGTADDKVPLDLSETYWRLASAAGDPCRFLRLDGVDHFQVIDPSEAAYQQVMAVALDWLAARPA